MTNFTRVGDSGALAGAATDIAVEQLGFYSLTAVRTGSGNLKLINWSTGGPGAVTRNSDSDDQAGEVSAIAVARNRNLTVTAVRDGSGDLLLISWDDGIGSGPISRLKDTHGKAGAASIVTIVPGPPKTAADLVTAVRAGNGSLKLISWALDNATGTITRLGDSDDQAGAVSLIAVSVPLPNVVLTAVRAGNGKLKLISWGFSEDGKNISRLGDSGDQAGEVSEIAMAGLVTAVRAGNGSLKLISWSLSPDGTQIQRLHDSDNHAGPATCICISRLGDARYVTAVRAGNGSLKLISWDVDPNSGIILRTGDSDDKAGAVSEVALAVPSGNNITTAVRAGNGTLKLIRWRMED
ncbi:hypothetical protein GCM10009825_38590 [Arthrobacter humicola]|uniref:WD40 repeat domain-containing protein n=1 Tax=Arthrobacter humicola TaxID=409291 RepID=A0ABP5LIF8_9MICC